MPIHPVPLEVDFSRPCGTIRPLHGVNLGPLMMNGWTDFSARFKELGFPSVRLHDCPYAVPDAVDVHSIFPIFDADPDDPGNYRFEVTDDYIQSTLDTGAEIVYRLGESIEHYPKRKWHVHPPRDFKKWADICIHIIRHYNDGWADGFRHNIRYWEIWNEPWVRPLCWTGTHADYYRLYEIAAQAIKSYNPKLRVGGPTAPGGVTQEFAEGFLDHCRRTNSPLDFFSWHLYTLEPVEVTEGAARMKEMLVRYGFPQTESHLNEWNYLPAEGWRFNSPEKDPDCTRRAIEEVSGINGAVFDAATLIYLQDCPVEVANFYWMRDGFWGLFDIGGKPQKNYYAFKAFRQLLDTPQRVQATANDPHTGYALLAGLAENKRGGVLLANLRARETNFQLRFKNWPWTGKARVEQYLLDYDRNLTAAGLNIIAGPDEVVTLSMPAPACSLMTLSPVT